ncbi:hypothetical protein [Hymenobacter koreensis]|uniref:EF-hand domain-containing protein n=1 Tax=Hymenobacter koreensis TaxID=1084523 RepID=A0ABP8IXK6_9BACT
MNTTSNLLRPLRLLGAALLLSAAVTACDTGDHSGATNVERGDDKINIDPGARTADGGVDSTRIQRNQTESKQEQQYERASQAKDLNNDGIED